MKLGGDDWLNLALSGKITYSVTYGWSLKSLRFWSPYLKAFIRIFECIYPSSGTEVQSSSTQCSTCLSMRVHVYINFIVILHIIKLHFASRKSWKHSLWWELSLPDLHFCWSKFGSSGQRRLFLDWLLHAWYFSVFASIFAFCMVEQKLPQSAY